MSRHRIDRTFVASGGRYDRLPAGCKLIHRGLPGDGGATPVSQHLTVCMATFGDARWLETGRTARDSVISQSVMPADFIWVHGDELHTARNTAVALVRTEFAVLLDADDRLDLGFVAAMDDVPIDVDIARPSVSINGAEAFLPAPRDLRETNYIHISARFRVSLFRSVGGFRAWPTLEDWDLWMRLFLAGATTAEAGGATLRIQHDAADRSRNSKSNVYRRWLLRRSWARLPFEYGGLRPRPVLADLTGTAARRASRLRIHGA